MFGIIGGLLGGWILGLFGFKAVVIAGMAQVFGVTLTNLGYYFLFGAVGALKSVVSFFGKGLPQLKKTKDSNTQTLKEIGDILNKKK